MKTPPSLALTFANRWRATPTTWSDRLARESVAARAKVRNDVADDTVSWPADPPWSDHVLRCVGGLPGVYPASYAGQPGDSGGTVWRGGSTTQSAALVGIHSGEAGNNRVFASQQDARTVLNVSWCLNNSCD